MAVKLINLDIQIDSYEVWGPPLLVVSMIGFGVFGRMVRSWAYSRYGAQIEAHSRSLRSDAQRQRQYADWAVYPGAALNAVLLSVYGIMMVLEWYQWSRARAVHADKSSVWQWLVAPELCQMQSADELEAAFEIVRHSKTILWVVAGHFCHDLIMSLDFGWRSNWTNVLHHCLCLLLILFVLATRILMFQLIAPALIMEASSIPLDIAWCVKQFDMPRLTHALNVTFALSFLLCRTVWWTAVFAWAHLVADPIQQAGFIPNVLLAILTLLQLYWTVLIFKKLFSGASKRETSKSKAT